MEEESALQVATGEHGISVSRIVPGMGQIELHADWPLLSRIPFRLSAGIPLPHFKVKQLAALTVGNIIETTWLGTADVPLKCGSTQIGWAEFEVVEHRLAVRITRLA